MTTIYEESQACVLCGAVGTFRGIASTNQMTPSDLDLRPGEMMRSTMSMWIRECGSCGYCAPDLGKSSPPFQPIVRSPKYQALRTDPRYPALASRFLRYAFILETTGDNATAFASALRAAWACDDEQKTDAAKSARLLALELAGRAEKAGQPLQKEPGARDLVIADLLRRTGKLAEARTLALGGARVTKDKTLQEALELQARIAEAGDDQAHSIGELESAQREEQERRRAFDESRARDAAKAKSAHERIVDKIYLCPTCLQGAPRTRVVRNADSGQCFTVCPSCGRSSPWKGTFPK